MIVNMTPHPVNIVDTEGHIVKTFPKGESTIRLSVSTVDAGSIAGVKVSKTVFSEPIGLPEYKEGTFYIVSQLVKNALPNRADLLVPAQVLRDSDNNILGCQSLGL